MAVTRIILSRRERETRMYTKGFNNVWVGLSQWVLELFAVLYDTALLPFRLAYYLMAADSY